MPISIVENCDCMTAMKRYPDKFWDLAIVDPPYGICADVNQNNAGVKWGFKKYIATNWDECELPTHSIADGMGFGD